MKFRFQDLEIWKSAIENNNILILLSRRDLISKEKLDELLNKLDAECRMITGFIRSMD